jgi:preflagellin peptidase FlaK
MGPEKGVLRLIAGRAGLKSSEVSQRVRHLGRCNAMAAWFLPAVIALFGLTALSIEDVRHREIDEKHVMLLFLAVAAASAYARPWEMKALLPSRVYVVLNVVLLIGVSVAALLGTLGWGDVAALLVMFVASPTVPRPGSLFPSLMLVLLYYLLAMLVYIGFNAAVNLLKHREMLKNIHSRRIRLLYTLMARPRKAQELVERPGWWYPLSLCGSYRVRFNIYLDPPDIAREVRKAIRSGCIRPEDYVWTTYGIPAVPLLTVAYAAALFVADKPLLPLLYHILSHRGSRL